MGVFAALGWDPPANLIDLHCEFVLAVNGLLPNGKGMRSLTGALDFYRIPHIEEAEKERMQKLAQSSAQLPDAGERTLIEYCAEDVHALGKLYNVMKEWIAEKQALFRGRYLTEVAWIEHRSTPIDVPTFLRLRDNWKRVLLELHRELDRGFGIYEDGHFRMKNFVRWLDDRGLLSVWPKTTANHLRTDLETFEAMTERLPEIHALARLQELRSQMKTLKLVVGPDGCNRVPLKPFTTETGRCAPSSVEYVFNVPAWLRSLIKPPRDRALAYIDYQRQEIGVAAAISGDEAMRQDYLRGDPYLALAERIGGGVTRDLCKILLLGIGYGMGARTLALRLSRPENEARWLLDFHRRTYRRFWEFNSGVVLHARRNHELHTCYGWMRHVKSDARDNELFNFPVQSTASEITRIATIDLAIAGIDVVASVHDALLVETASRDVDDVVKTAQRVMTAAANRVVGLEIGDGREGRFLPSPVHRSEGFRDVENGHRDPKKALKKGVPLVPLHPLIRSNRGGPHPLHSKHVI